MNWAFLASASAAMLFSAVPTAFAHHSYAMFDLRAETVLTGTVTEFQWTNPHTWIELDVLDASGKVIHWSLENGSVTGLVHQGWKRSTLKVGDKISVV